MDKTRLETDLEQLVAAYRQALTQATQLEGAIRYVQQQIKALDETPPPVEEAPPKSKRK